MSTASIQFIPRSTLAVINEILVEVPEKLPEYVVVLRTVTCSPDDPRSNRKWRRLRK
jgi:hypothetical protein